MEMAKIKVWQRRIRDLQKLEADLSHIIHELKSPLQVILNATEYLEMKLSAADSDTKTALKTIKKRVLELDGIVQNLVKFYRSTELKSNSNQDKQK